MSSAQDEIFTPPKKIRREKVPWAHKHWMAFSESDRQGLKAWMETFTDPEQARAYRLYMNQWAGVPKEFFYE